MMVSVIGMTHTTETHTIAGYALTLAAVPGGFTVNVAPATTGGLPIVGPDISALRSHYADLDSALAAKRNAYRFLATGGRIVRRADGGVDLIPGSDATAHSAAEAASVVKLAPPAKGTETKVSDPGLAALSHAITAGGYIHRGGLEGQAPVPVLTALAKRGHVRLDIQMHGRRKYTAGAWITRAGRIAHLRATGGDRLIYDLSA